MVVLNWNKQDMATVIDALECYQESFSNMLKNVGENDAEEVEELEKMVEYTGEVKDKFKEMDLQELTERCMSYFWDRVCDGAADEWPEVENLCDDMGVSADELIELFRKAGFE